MHTPSGPRSGRTECRCRSNYAAAPHRCNQAAAEEYDRGGLRHGARPAGTGKASELAAVFIVWPGGEIDLVGIAAVPPLPAMPVRFLPKPAVSSHKFRASQTSSESPAVVVGLARKMTVLA
jgi:hypothetical protein